MPIQPHETRLLAWRDLLGARRAAFEWLVDDDPHIMSGDNTLGRVLAYRDNPFTAGDPDLPAFLKEYKAEWVP